MVRGGIGRRAALLALGGGMLSGCAGAPPFGGRQAPIVAAAPAAAGPLGTIAGLPVMADGTVLVPAVRATSADRGRQGVILRAEGVAPIQGFHSPELRTIARGADGIETVELRAMPPLGDEPVGQERTRLLQAARFYSNREMREIRGFRIVAAGNSLSAAAP
jgi:hypothetical protein